MADKISGIRKMIESLLLITYKKNLLNSVKIERGMGKAAVDFFGEFDKIRKNRTFAA